MDGSVPCTWLEFFVELSFVISVRAIREIDWAESRSVVSCQVHLNYLGAFAEVYGLLICEPLTTRVKPRLS